MAEEKARTTIQYLVIAVFLVASAAALVFILASFTGETKKIDESLLEQDIEALIDALLEAEPFIENDYVRRTGRIAEKLMQAERPARQAIGDALDRTTDEFARSRLNAVLACMRWKFSPYTMFLLDSQNQFVGELYTRSVPPKGEWFPKLQKAFDEKDAPGLIKMFTDEMNTEASYYIFEFLAELGEEALEPLLEGLLKERHPYAAFCIRIALMRVAPRNLAKLREYAADPKEKVRAVAVRALGLSSSKEAVPALLSALGDESADVRYNAATMLSLIPDRRAVDGLVKALKDADDDVAATAARTLGIIGDPEAIKPLKVYFHSGRPGARENAASALAGMGEKSTQVLTSLLKDTDEEVRVAAAVAMSELRSPSTSQSLLEALLDKSPAVRTAAAGALAYLRGSRVTAALRSSLSDSDPDVRTEAARALGRLRDTASTEALAAALKDEVVTVRLAAINALGRVSSGKALEVLVSSLANPELAPLAAPGVRGYGDSAGQVLLKALPEMPVETRHWAIGLLAEAKVRDAVPVLLGYLEHPDVNLRFCADKALRMITGHETSYKCDAPEAERAEGAREWRKWWEKNK